MKISNLFEAENDPIVESIKSSQYPKELPNDWAIAEYAESVCNEEGVDVELIREMYRGYKAVLKSVKTASLTPGDPNHNIPDPELEKRYLKMNPETMPPILVESGVVVDGNHRFRVAKALGMTNIWAYVLVDDSEPF